MISLLNSILTVFGIMNMHSQSTESVYSRLADLQLLPRFHSSKSVGMVSSYDRTGGNDDGFSGKFSYIRKEGDALVIADLKGPGCITRIWTPTPSNALIEFIFDGETSPKLSLPFEKLFDGTSPYFPTPLSGFGSGGFYTYAPIPYQKSCKVRIRAPKFQFYQINFATYSDSSLLQSWSSEWYQSQNVPRQAASEMLSSASNEISLSVGSTDKLKSSGNLTTSRPFVLFQSKTGGRISEIRLRPASVISGKKRSIVLRITWDGDKIPAVYMPAADFFGYSWGAPAANSVLVGTKGRDAYARFPMPFDRSAKIELVQTDAGAAPVGIEAEVTTTKSVRSNAEGKFYAIWNRENPTTKGKPFTFMDVKGKGHLIGVTLQSQGSETGQTLFFEGDDVAIIDGKMAAHGTGSEDFFNGGWYDVPGRWDQRNSFPMSGCLDYHKALGRTGAYRFFLADAYAFSNSLNLTIEHSGENNTIDADYVGVSYLYCDRHPEGAGKPITATDVAIIDPKQVTYVTGWSVPIQAFSFEHAIFGKRAEKIGLEFLRYFYLEAAGGDVFGDHFVSFQCELPADGRYKVIAKFVNGPNQGVVQLFQNEHTAGPPVDLFCAAKQIGANVPLGELSLLSGPNPIMLKLVGKSDKSSALGMQLVQLVFEKMEK